MTKTTTEEPISTTETSHRPDLLEWCCLVVGFTLVVRYGWFLDDAFVYFRYVDNLLYLGHGLVYNEGEFVEGYSSPLWCLLLIALRWIGLEFREIVLIAGALCFVFFWWGLLRLHRIAHPTAKPFLNLPMALLCTNYAVLTYFTSGLESPLVALAAVVTALFVFEPTNKFYGLGVALSPLIRPEFAVSLAIVLGWQWWSLRKPTWFTLCAALTLNLSWLAFRIYYYADIFPNTYYLKNVVFLGQGFEYVHDTLIAYGGYIIFPICLAFLLIKRSAPFAARLVLLAIVVTSVAYTIKIGGDPRHFRYLQFAYIVLVCGLASAPAAALSNAFNWKGIQVSNNRMAKIGGAIVVCAAIFTVTCYPRQVTKHPFFPDAGYTSVNRIVDAHVARTIIGGLFDLVLIMEDDIYKAKRYPDAPSEEYEGLIVTGACGTGYQEYDHRILNYYGLTDAVLARTEMPSNVAAHKFGLRRLGFDLAVMQAELGPPRVGAFDLYVERRKAPAWIQENIDSLRLIERKMYNDHSFVENLSIAFTQIPFVVPPVIGENFIGNDRFLLVGRARPELWFFDGTVHSIDYPEFGTLRIFPSLNNYRMIQEFSLPEGQHTVDVSVEVSWKGAGRVTLRASEVVAPDYGQNHPVANRYVRMEGTEELSVDAKGLATWEALRLTIETSEDNPRPAIRFVLDVDRVGESFLSIRNPKGIVVR